MLLPEPQEIKNYIQKDKTYLGFGNLIVKDNLSSKLGMYTGIKFLEKLLVWQENSYRSGNGKR